MKKIIKIEKYEELETMAEETAKEYAFRKLKVKDFDAYMIKTEGYFGIALLIYKNNSVVYVDSELHYHWVKTKHTMFKKMLNKANLELYTENELIQPIKSYSDYYYKTRFLNNYYQHYHNGISMWDEKSKRVKDNWFFAKFISFCYYEHKEDVDKLRQLYEGLGEQHKAKCLDDEYFKKAISYELSNHEYVYGGQESLINALDALGLTVKSLTPTQKQILEEECHRQIMTYA